ncbi:MAG: glutaminase A [Tissierellia bacterium]|nr:glutaminase A [Tissierellia bacterium]
MERLLNKLIERNKYLTKYGKVADYIPALGNANPQDIGVCIMDIDGDIYTGGDYNKKFTIQSISKIISLMLAIMDKGEEEVFKKVGMEPTVEPFSSLYKLDLSHCEKPSNPMINSGAIVTTSLIEGKGEEKFNRLLKFMKKIILKDNLNYNKEVYLSEKETGYKNRAIAYLLKQKGLIEGNVENILDIYFKQCSIEVDCIDLAKIGIFIANKCKNPKSKEVLCDEKIASIIIPIMTTCGMYNFSGEYAINVGIPSKSGVAGGILAVVPGRYGIGVYGPALDGYGNSIVGYEILKDLSKELNLSIFK